MTARQQCKTLLCTAALVLACSTPLAVLAAQATPLPDWSGIWQLRGRGEAKASATAGAAAKVGERNLPPYNAEWQKKFNANAALANQDRFPDPLSFCGIPVGYPRVLNLPDSYEFVVRPERVWILTENGPNLMRIYTDGRDHPAADLMWPTYTGDSVGHWEGDTLVFDTISIKNDGDTIFDRNGVVFSDRIQVVTRIRLTAPDTLTADLTVTDPGALTESFKIVRQFRRIEASARVYDYACRENNRNPIDANGKTLTLGTDGRVIDLVP